VSVMGLTRCYKTTVFLHLLANNDKTTTDTTTDIKMYATCLEEAKPNEARRQMFVFR